MGRLSYYPAPSRNLPHIAHLIGALGDLWEQCQLARMPMAAQ